MMKKRILHVSQDAVGVDRYIRMLLKYLDKDKFENVLFYTQDFHEEDYKGRVISFEQIEMSRAIGGNDLKAIKVVRALIKKYNLHGWAFNMRCSTKKKAIYMAIEKAAAPFCEKIICISDAEKQSALDKKIYKKEDKLQVIFNGVDIEAYVN